MATVAFGRIEEFRPEADNITNYLERMELFFVANSIAEDKQTAVLLSCMGSKAYATVKNLLAPDSPSTKSFTELKASLKSHYDPKPSIIGQRFKFHRRKQNAGESIADFSTALRQMAIDCDFKASLDDALRDQFVSGLRSEAMHRRLLTEDKLTLSRAVEVATGMEMALKDAKSFQGNEQQRIHQFSTGQRQPRQACKHCGKSNHSSGACYFKAAKCHSCGKSGHIATVCKTPRKKPQSDHKQGTNPPNPRPSTHSEAEHFVSPVHDTDGNSPEEEGFGLFAVNSANGAAPKPIIVTVQIEGKDIPMEVDTGAGISIVPLTTWTSHFQNLPLQKSTVQLKTYTKERLSVLGQRDVSVKYGDQVKKLQITVVEGDGPNLLGRDWLLHLRLDWTQISKISRTTQLDALLQEYDELFHDELGTVKNFKASLLLKDSPQPKFFRSRQVPFAIRDTVGRELDGLEAAGIIEKVPHSDWAAPIVAVPKKDGRLRICGDYKVTINPVLEVDQHPLPRPEELYATLSGGKKFSILDLSQAYTQILLDDTSSGYVTINTHKGLYKYKRLPYGVASAPAIFQKLMETVLNGIPNVVCYLDDILVTGKDDQDHLDNLRAVLNRLREYGLRIKQSKCKFLQPSVEYLGHVVDATGLHATPDKVDAIVNAPTPTDLTQLRAFLGLINYYSKFLPNLSHLLHPLNNLLRKGQKRAWTAACAAAFKEAKEALASSEVLVHYDPGLPIRLAADASSYGVGAVLSHVLPDGTERPIAYISKTLSPSEKNYAQIEKEALALVFGVRKFHQYVYGRKFTLVKPLLSILGPKTGIPSLAAARMQRWSFLLSAYQYDIIFKPTASHCNADGLSRLPQGPPSQTDPPSEVTMFNIGQIHNLPVSAVQVQRATKGDPILSKVYRLVKDGWPNYTNDPDLDPYWAVRTELTLEGDCLLRGIRVVVPPNLRHKVLEELHLSHPGIQRMKLLARGHAWWPRIDHDIQDMVKSCPACQEVKQAPPVAPLQPWIWPSQPWKRIHIDFAGPFMGGSYLIVVDAHSKWPEVQYMTTTTASKTIQVLRQLFARHGLPEQLVSDNGPQFVSEEFGHFLKQNGVKHIKCSPYHPSSNGQAERFVRTFKQAIRAGERECLPLDQRLDNFLLMYRVTPHATTGVAPCELFLGRDLRTRLHIMEPRPGTTVCSKQAAQKAPHDRRAKTRDFCVGQEVMARNHRDGAKYLPGVLVQRLGPLTFLVEVKDGIVWRRHVDHLKPLQESASERTPSSDPAQPDQATEEEVYFPFDNEPANDGPADDGQPEPPPAPPDGPPPPQRKSTATRRRRPPPETRKQYPLRSRNPNSTN